MKGFNFNVVEIYEEPRKKILPKLDSKGYGPEMSEFESGFLCGLIKEFRPDTIVEAGVAGGGYYSGYSAMPFGTWHA